MLDVVLTLLGGDLSLFSPVNDGGRLHSGPDDINDVAMSTNDIDTHLPSWCLTEPVCNFTRLLTVAADHGKVYKGLEFK